MPAKILHIDSATASRAVAAVFGAFRCLAADEEVVLDQGVIKRLAGVVAEAVSGFNHGVVQDDIANAVAVQFEGAVG